MYEREQCKRNMLGSCQDGCTQELPKHSYTSVISAFIQRKKAVYIYLGAKRYLTKMRVICKKVKFRYFRKRNDKMFITEL